MSRNPADRLIDIAVACERIAEYAGRSEASDDLVFDDLVFDAIRIQLVGASFSAVMVAVSSTRSASCWSASSRARIRSSTA